MGDPAVEAAQRAHEANLGKLIDHDTVLAAAREALSPIRKLHQRSFYDGPICSHCIDIGDDGEFWGYPWPCETAKLVYTSEELAEDGWLNNE